MNHLLGLFSANQVISAVLDFPEKLDIDILERAFQVTLRLYPVLGCRFTEAEEPYWESGGVSGGSIFAYEICHGGSTGEQVKEYLVKPRRDWNAQIQAKLFRVKTDILCVKISHLCSDATGLKEYMTALGITDIKSAIRQNNTGLMWAFPSDPEKNDAPDYCIRRLPPDRMKPLIARCKKQDATVNDAIIAAYLRALEKQAVFAESHGTERMIGVTVDLRRYLTGQTTGTVCSLSGMETPLVEMHENDTFEMTLAHVKQAMDAKKSNRPGLSSAAGMECMSKVPFSSIKGFYRQQHEKALQTKTALPLLTNTGIMHQKGVQFGCVQASDGYLIPPIMYSPFFCVGAGTYNDTLTLSVGFHSPAVSEDAVNQLLEDMARELS